MCKNDKNTNDKTSNEGSVIEIRSKHVCFQADDSLGFDKSTFRLKRKGLNLWTCSQIGQEFVVLFLALSRSKTSSSFPSPLSECSRPFIMTRQYLMPLQKYFSFLQEGIHWAFNHSQRLSWQIHIRGGLELHFSRFYCCSSLCPCITLRNGTVRTIKWNHILHGPREHCELETIT